MINMKDLIKKQTDMIRKESGMNIKKKRLDESEQYGLKFSPTDHYVVHNSLRNMYDDVNGVGYSESYDIYGWNDKNNYTKAVGELNKEVLKIVAPIHKAKEKFKKEAGNTWKVKEKIFKKWRSKDGSKQGD